MKGSGELRLWRGHRCFWYTQWDHGTRLGRRSTSSFSCFRAIGSSRVDLVRAKSFKRRLECGMFASMGIEGNFLCFSGETRRVLGSEAV